MSRARGKIAAQMATLVKTFSDLASVSKGLTPAEKKSIVNFASSGEQTSIAMLRDSVQGDSCMMYIGKVRNYYTWVGISEESIKRQLSNATKKLSNRLATQKILSDHIDEQLKGVRERSEKAFQEFKKFKNE